MKLIFVSSLHPGEAEETHPDNIPDQPESDFELPEAMSASSAGI